jgi:hypothetical protein
VSEWVGEWPIGRCLMHERMRRNNEKMRRSEGGGANPIRVIQRKSQVRVPINTIIVILNFNSQKRT